MGWIEVVAIIVCTPIGQGSAGMSLGLQCQNKRRTSIQVEKDVSLQGVAKDRDP